MLKSDSNIVLFLWSSSDHPPGHLTYFLYTYSVLSHGEALKMPFLEVLYYFCEACSLAVSTCQCRGNRKVNLFVLIASTL